mmetsp:Transcript_74009/g.145258  ORF Transcript_74009/g.145258 Transcript_74009/m.145258 type:complete len:169 (-) Transcript_74009:93-599(-)
MTRHAQLSLLALAFAAGCSFAAGDDEEEFQDTPLLTAMWQATSSGDNDALDRLLDSSESAVKVRPSESLAKARASDGRGLAWWAFEFQNVYALGAIVAYDGDLESQSKDLSGQSAMQMCVTNPECKVDKLIAEAKSLAADIRKRKEERAKERDQEFEDDEEDIGDDEF